MGLNAIAMDEGERLGLTSAWSSRELVRGKLGRAGTSEKVLPVQRTMEGPSHICMR